MLYISFAAIMFCFPPILAAAENAPTAKQPFSKELSPEQVRQLSEQKLVYRSIGNLKKSGLSSDNPDVLLAKAKIRSVNPTYLSETIFMLPYEKNKTAFEKLFTVLDDVSGYAGIPYWSLHWEEFFQLYSYVKDIERKKTANTSDVNALFKMNPFDEFAAHVELKKNNDSLFYSMENTKAMAYNGLSLVKPHNMVSCFVMFRHEENLVFYGIGGAKVPLVPFYASRIEDSIMGRVKAFSEFVYGKF